MVPFAATLTFCILTPLKSLFRPPRPLFHFSVLWQKKRPSRQPQRTFLRFLGEYLSSTCTSTRYRMDFILFFLFLPVLAYSYGDLLENPLSWISRNYLFEGVSVSSFPFLFLSPRWSRSSNCWHAIAIGSPPPGLDKNKRGSRPKMDIKISPLPDI